MDGVWPSTQEPYAQEPENKPCAHNAQGLSAQELGAQEPEKKPSAQQEPYVQERKNKPCAQHAQVHNLCTEPELQPGAQEQESEQDSANAEFFFLCSLNRIEWPGVASHEHLV